MTLCIPVGSAQDIPASAAPANTPPAHPAVVPQSEPPEKTIAHLQARIEAMQKRLADWAELTHFRDANRNLPPPKEGEKRVVFFGDSITSVWKLEDSFPGKGYINRGITSQTTPQLLLRFRSDVLDLHPDVVVILAGTNDIAGNTGPMTTGQIEDNYASMAELARVHGVHVIFASVLPVHGYTPRAQQLHQLEQRPPEKILELNQWLKQNAAVYGYTYLDYFTPMVDERGFMQEALAPDGLHPNASGYAIMAKTLAPVMEKVVRGSKRGKK
ncbi:MAG TPA: GDSL-type esterase/lipase family protein [Terriglobales bacterium]|nr:GDSL-type esterase/lipase family protein [Terriglobales bacterium]